MSKVYEIKKETALKVFKALGFKTAAKWDNDRIIDKLKNLGELVEGTNITNPKLKKIVNKITKAKEIQLKGLPEVAKKKKKAKKDAKKKNTKKTSKKVTKKTKVKKVGVCATILAYITEKGPVSKKQILAHLVKKFPDRPEDGMKNTISIQVPGRLNKDKNANIKKNNKDKFFIGKKKKK